MSSVLFSRCRVFDGRRADLIETLDVLVEDVAHDGRRDDDGEVAQKRDGEVHRERGVQEDLAPEARADALERAPGDGGEQEPEGKEQEHVDERRGATKATAKLEPEDRPEHHATPPVEGGVAAAGWVVEGLPFEDRAPAAWKMVAK